MTTQTRTTELEAVNTILSTIGEAPLSTLTGSLPVDGTTAKNVLNEINREVQSAGWQFNTHYKVDFTRDSDNKIPVGTDVLRVELNTKYNKSSYDITQRDSYLYNLAKNTNIFDQDFTDNTLIYLLDFDKLPEQARRYITIRSARVFHDRTLGANTLHKFSQEDEKQALSILVSSDAHQSKKSTVVYQENWHKGILGIVCNRLQENYYRPTIVLTKSGDNYTGSARSVKGYNIYNAINANLQSPQTEQPLLQRAWFFAALRARGVEDRIHGYLDE